MPTSLQGIAKKAAQEKSYRFRNLFGMLTVVYVLSGWPLLNKRAASGVDSISARAYGNRLHDHVTSLVERVKTQCYRAKFVRRHYIPKGNGALRPLGIPATEDKLLQMAVARILDAIYEPDFLPSSYGYRKKIGARDAVRDLTRHRPFGPYNSVVEADIKGFFDHIDHERLLEMLRLRIEDRPFLRLIKKWLKAGVLDTDGQVLHPVTGLPKAALCHRSWRIFTSITSWMYGSQKSSKRIAKARLSCVGTPMTLSVPSSTSGMRSDSTGCWANGERNMVESCPRRKRDCWASVGTRKTPKVAVISGLYVFVGQRTAKARIGSSVRPHGRG